MDPGRLLLGLTAIILNSWTDVTTTSTTTKNIIIIINNTSTTTNIISSSSLRDPREYCAAEEFEPKCSSSKEVVMVTDARYGRMETGHCVQVDYGYVGCSADVLDHLDQECSGKRSCKLEVPDSELEKLNQCPKEFKAYLNVSYECIPVESAMCGSCNSFSSSRFAKVSRPNGYIGSIVTMESKTTSSSSSSSCGSTECPWIIEVESGQTINLTLYDFSQKNHEHPSPASSSGHQCLRLAVIKEAMKYPETPICYRQNRRKEEIYSSVSNSIQIHIVSPEVIKNKGQFIIEYRAVGCPDFQAPENAWQKRYGDRVEIGCHEKSLKWEIRCVDTTWDGEIGTCPDLRLQPTPSPFVILTLPLGVLISIVLGIALVIGVFIVTIGVVCLKRQQNGYHESGAVMYFPAGQCYELREDPSSSSTAGHSGSMSGRKMLTSTLDRASKDRLLHQHHQLHPPPPPPSHHHHHHQHQHHQQQQQHHHQQQMMSQAGKRNVYAHSRMKSRPLPSIPNLAEGGAGASNCDHGRSSGSCDLHRCSSSSSCSGVNKLQVDISNHGVGDACRFHAIATRNSPTAAAVHLNQGFKNPTKPGRRGGGGRREETPMHIPLQCSSFASPPSPPPLMPTSQIYTVLDPMEVQQLLVSICPAASTSAAVAAASSVAASRDVVRVSGPSTSAASGEGGGGGGGGRDDAIRPFHQQQQQQQQPLALRPTKLLSCKRNKKGNNSWP